MKKRSYKQRAATRNFLARASFRSKQNRQVRKELKEGPDELTWALFSFVVPGTGQLIQGKRERGIFFLCLWICTFPFYLILIGPLLSMTVGCFAAFDILKELKSKDADDNIPEQNPPTEAPEKRPYDWQ